MAFFGTRDFLLEVSKGTITGHENITFGGANPSIGKSFETLWDAGGIYTAPTAAETWEILSDSTDDDGSPIGTGARTIVITGLDTAYAEQTEVIIMNGTTPVVTTRTDWFRPRAITVITSGSNRANVGTITLRVSGGGALRSTILPDNAQSFNGFYTVPAGLTAYLLQYTPTIPKNEDVSIRSLVTLLGSGTDISGGEAKVYQNAIAVAFQTNPVLVQKTDFHLLAKSTNEDVNVSIGFELIEVVQDITQDLQKLRIF